MKHHSQVLFDFVDQIEKVLHCSPWRDDAIQLYDSALRLVPGFPTARIAKARIGAFDHRYDEALAEVDDVLKQSPNLPEALSLRGDLMLALNRVDDALKAFEALVAVRPTDVIAHQNVVSLLLRQNKLDDAGAKIAAMRKALGNHPMAVYLQAFLDTRQGKMKEAYDELQQVLAEVAAAGHITEEQASQIRSALSGATLRCTGGATATVQFIAEEGLLLRSSGPNGLSVTRPESSDMNDHGAATSVHADQDVYGTPLTQLMDGRAPTLFRHDSPDGHNHDATLMLVNAWIPLQQITQPLAMADPRTLDRRRHQLRYGLVTSTFLERDDDMVINDIWTFLHDPDQRWFLRSEMDHRSAYLFNTLSTAHGAGTLPGEDVAERSYRALEDAEAAVEAGDPVALVDALAPALHPDLPEDTTPALRDAIAEMASVAAEAHRDPEATCGERAEPWTAAARAARNRVIRRSIELRMVVSVDR